VRRRYSGYGHYRRRRRIWPLFVVLLLLLGAAGYFVYSSPRFERVKPTIKTPDIIYAGSKKPIRVILEDNRALGQYQVLFGDGQRTIVAASGSFDLPMKRTEISVTVPPQVEEGREDAPWRMRVVLKDKSLWNYIGDNIAIRTVKVVADTKPPVITLIAKSATMARGGSALVIFKAEDANLKECYLLSGGIKFKAVPYRKKGYFAALIAWPFQKKRMDIAIVATDIGGNSTQKKVTFPKVHRNYKVSQIVVSDRFLDGKIVQVAQRDPQASKVKGKLSRFKAVNETMRISNETLIHKFARRTPKALEAPWKVRAFYPLKGAKLVADFGDERHYFYRDKSREISRSYHVGYDFASTRHAPIISSNPGTVVFAGYNGIYGKMPLIDHGFGLYTLYGHCSRILVEEGEEVEAGQTIARTGSTGLALGDHLHFGILVQGVEVWPMDWMKGNWIKKNIDKVFEKADRIIGP